MCVIDLVYFCRVSVFHGCEIYFPCDCFVYRAYVCFSFFFHFPLLLFSLPCSPSKSLAFQALICSSPASRCFDKHPYRSWHRDLPFCFFPSLLSLSLIPLRAVLAGFRFGFFSRSVFRFRVTVVCSSNRLFCLDGWFLVASGRFSSLEIRLVKGVPSHLVYTIHSGFENIAFSLGLEDT